MKIYLLIAIISLTASLQAQKNPNAPSPSNGQLSPINVASLDELKRLASQQRGNLMPNIVQVLRKNKVQPLSVSVSPNPANTEVELIITDLLGRAVAREKLRTELTNFNTQDWAKGMYVWSLVEDGLVVKSGKVVKE
jgi:hypothetical protein